MKDENGRPLKVGVDYPTENPDQLQEAIVFWGEPELISLAGRDENSNRGNVIRAAMAAALEDNPADIEGAKAKGLEAGRAYDAGEKTKRGSGAGTKAKLAFVIAKVQSGDAEALQVLTQIGGDAAHAEEIALAYWTKCNPPKQTA
jgi:hypothetical protein